MTLHGYARSFSRIVLTMALPALGQSVHPQSPPLTQPVQQTPRSYGRQIVLPVIRPPFRKLTALLPGTYQECTSDFDLTLTLSQQVSGTPGTAVFFIEATGTVDGRPL